MDSTSIDILRKALLSLLGSSLLCYLLIVFFKRLALRAGAVATPRKDRFHDQPVPLLGGNAIYLAFLTGLTLMGMIGADTWLILVIGLSIMLFGLFRRRSSLVFYFCAAIVWSSVLGLISAETSENQVLGLLLGGTILVYVGNVDDVSGGIIPYVKLLGQAIAGFFLIYFGIRMSFFIDLGYEWGLPWLGYMAYPVTLFWIIGMTNAFNLIDNMNGLSCGVAVISSLFFGLMSFVNGQTHLGYILFIFMGAGLGYLPHNFPRAKIFMGDSGSMFIGFVIAGLSIVGSWTRPEGWVTDKLRLSLVIPILVLIYPIFDTALVVVTRMIRGCPITLGGKDHSSHRLVRMGLQPADAVLLIYSFCSFAGFCGLFLTMIGYDQALLMLAFLVMFILLVGLRLAKIDVRD